VKCFRCFSQSQAGICCLCKTAVYNAVNQTVGVVNKHADHICVQLVTEGVTFGRK